MGRQGSFANRSHCDNMIAEIILISAQIITD